MSLGKHKYYCEMCQKQCKDENAFAQHKRSSQHQSNMIEFNENPEAFIGRFSRLVQDAFVELCRIKYGYASYVPANRAYNEYIRDPYHTHLNSTKWATLSEFVLDLERQGIVETEKAVDAAGNEQLMMRMVDKDRDRKARQAELESKEHKRELERKREEKELEKIIRLANKAQREHQSRPVKIVEDNAGAATGMFQFETAAFNIGQGDIDKGQPEEKKEEVAKHVKASIFSKEGDDSKKELEMLVQKTKKTNMDKLLEHTTSHSSASILPNKRQNQQDIQTKETTWVKQGLIVKIRKEGQFNKQKGEVVKVRDINRIVVKMQESGKEQEFQEKDLQKVLPSEGGRVMIFSHNTVATLTHIDLKQGMITAKVGDLDGNKKVYKVKIEDCCKVNL